MVAMRGVRDFPEDRQKSTSGPADRVQGLTDRSRRPHRHANQLPMVVEKTIVKIKREYPSWGAPKIRERLRQRGPRSTVPPSARCMRSSTVTGS